MDEHFFNMFKEFEIKSNETNKNFADLAALIKQMSEQIKVHKEENEKKIAMMKVYDVVDGEIVNLNIGGKKFSTFKTTIEKRIKRHGQKKEYYGPHLLQGLISGLVKVRVDKENAIFIDRDPQMFNYILNYLRFVDTDSEKESFKLPDSIKSLEMLSREALFYRLDGLKESVLQRLTSTANRINTLDSNIISNEEFEQLTELCDLPLIVSELKKTIFVYLFFIFSILGKMGINLQSIDPRLHGQ